MTWGSVITLKYTKILFVYMKNNAYLKKKCLKAIKKIPNAGNQSQSLMCARQVLSYISSSQVFETRSHISQVGRELTAVKLRLALHLWSSCLSQSSWQNYTHVLLLLVQENKNYLLKYIFVSVKAVCMCACICHTTHLRSPYFLSGFHLSRMESMDPTQSSSLHSNYFNLRAILKLLPIFVKTK